ncbi:hypothetical protein GWK47_009050 [Chionoecetes opilio]|uniref:Uncharacterized protein n=1 Tax=Chionoecetes opilio TaxID=41210 RepID=A0A8J4XYT9_CHIOP|nr:hypothetical protein GWK47_009050 [Chionoecetes opilio]
MPRSDDRGGGQSFSCSQREPRTSSMAGLDCARSGPGGDGTMGSLCNGIGKDRGPLLAAHRDAKSGKWGTPSPSGKTKTFPGGILSLSLGREVISLTCREGPGHRIATQSWLGGGHLLGSQRYPADRHGQGGAVPRDPGG